MSNSPEVEALLRNHAEARRREFAEPDFDTFRAVYGGVAPDVLVELYSLGRVLLETEVQFETLWVQSFCPLSAKLIKESAERYGCRFYRFATGGEGQAILLRVSDPASIWMDSDFDGNCVEELPVAMAELLRDVRGRHGA